MRRGRYFFTAFIAAAITFGSLTAFVNPKYSGMRYGYGSRFWNRGWHNRYNPYWNYPPPYYMDRDSAYRNYHQPDNGTRQY